MGPDSLTTLEERIRSAAELVSRLRSEKDQALAAAAEVEPLHRRIAELTHELDLTRAERDNLRAERETVRRRVEKLLEQIDAMETA
jgi:uncharacterized coiled-coil DUF342 family protein